MRFAIFAAALGLGVAACAPLSEPEPRDAHLTRDMLTVSLSDGQRCHGPRPQGAGPGGWAGTLQGCSVGYPYSVWIDPAPNPLRQVVEAVFAALQLDDQLELMAEVEVTGPGGRAYRFTSPSAIED